MIQKMKRLHCPVADLAEFLWYRTPSNKRLEAISCSTLEEANAEFERMNMEVRERNSQIPVDIPLDIYQSYLSSERN